MKLYYMPGACSLASHIALLWAGAPYELKKLEHEETKSDAYLKINPKGLVPTLVLEDGRVVTESLAVLLYIAERYPQAHLGADSDIFERARLNEVLAELVSEFHKSFAPMFAPERFVTKDTLHENAKQAAFKKIDQQYQRFEKQMEGRDWLLDHRTVADAYLYVITRWAEMTPRRIDAYPVLARFKDRLDADESVKRALAEEELS